ncbi:uncharacterized protein LOC113371424 [Ctenocephalides felis]|uniref:uncharacterized protein LOC113371424 n=1 Tax=Ctenocephalides felis TaxID=7515 RepID=UPI000E6E404A|nr:uncharacterized protein LOC113371424 [Ctenocephalides felis]
MADIETLEAVHEIIKTSFDTIREFVAGFREDDKINLLSVRKQKLVERSHEWETNYIEVNRLKPGEDIPKNSIRVSNSSVDVKLPDIVLPTFSGEFSEWTAFIDLYNSLIHTNTKLSDVQKLHYLKGALTGSASNIISSSKLSNENYTVAYNLILKTYDNKFLIINAHLNSIDKISSISKGSFENLRAFLNNARQQVQALTALFEPVKYWDVVLLFMLSKKLDNNTRVAWNLSQASAELPTLNSFFNFIEMRVVVLENSSSDCKGPSAKTVNTIVKKASQPCICCKREHALFQCADFKALDVEQKRKELVSKHLFCVRCIASRRGISKCKYKYPCSICKESHNSLLHEEKVSPINNSNILMTHSNPQTLLSTVSLIIFDANGKRHSVRALLDSGSQINLITKSLASRLQLPINSSLYNISVLQGQSMTCNKSVKIKIKSKLTSFEHKSNRLVDDAELYFDILQQGCIRLGKNLPILRNSRFGWLLSGVYSGDAGSESYVGFVSNEDLHEELARFWQVEEVSLSNSLTGSDKACEEHFVSNVHRLGNGQFEVALPFIDGKKYQLGNSFTQARTRFLNLERRLVKNKDLNLAYSNFINEYAKLGHAELTSLTGEDFDNKYYFLPVFKDGNVNKIRVVFDASCKTSTGLSLNNVMHTGPKLQQDLFSILIRIRCHLYVFVADIVKMYRQIKVRDADANLQLIIWRDSPQKRLDIYKLNTVTYGTSCAPYLAMRCLKMLSEVNFVKYPLASQTLDRDSYVDDIITGASSEQELGQLKLEVCSLLKLGCFQLHKWSNFSEQNNTVKTLGLSWNPVEDIFKISYSNLFITSTDTKRYVLSTIARIYDPIGLISPITITAKLIMQELWKCNLDWEDALPDELQDSWNDFRHHLSCLEGLSVPRCFFKQVPVSIQCHGFADASLLAYGACVYLRATYEDGSISCHLICSKSKVAPLKQVTLPRLELLAAFLLAKLYRRVMANGVVKINESFLWSDSSIVLAWLRTEPSQLKMFVSNRVSQILELTPAVMWKHVSSKDNPADIVSRGVRIASDLLSCDLWWHGPSWLCSTRENWPNRFCDPPKDKLPETRVLCAVSNTEDDDDIGIVLKSLSDRVSKFSKLVRIVAYCLRWRKKRRTVPLGDPLPAFEIQFATLRIFYLVQLETFSITNDEDL